MARGLRCLWIIKSEQHPTPSVSHECSSVAASCVRYTSVSLEDRRSGLVKARRCRGPLAARGRGKGGWGLGADGRRWHSTYGCAAASSPLDADLVEHCQFSSRSQA